MISSKLLPTNEYLRIKKGEKKVYVDFNLTWRFRHSEGSKAQIFYALTETILTSSLSPSSVRMSGLPLFCFFLLFPLELTFCQKTASPVLFTKLNSLLRLHLWLTKLHLFTAHDFLPTSRSRSQTFRVGLKPDTDTDILILFQRIWK